MTEEEKTVLMIKGAIADMSQEHQAEVKECYEALKQMIQEKPLAAMAIALIGAELAV